MSAARPLIGITAGYDTDRCNGWPLLSLRPAYSRAVALGGGAPVVIPLGLNQDDLRGIYNRLDGLLFSGGGDIEPGQYNARPGPFTVSVNAERDKQEMCLVRWALDEEKPLLAICRGHQVLNVALGGDLYQDIRSEIDSRIRHDLSPAWFERTVHHVDISPGSNLRRIIDADTLEVNSLHHQAIRSAGSGLSISALSGDGIVEAVELGGHRFALGVQWHPEALAESYPQHRDLFQALAAAC